MQIHWFPGHMHKARKEIAKIMPKIDVVIELIDARVPDASSNPLLTELCKSKPMIKVMTKADLADPKMTKAWMTYFKSQGHGVLDLNNKDKKAQKKITLLCKKLSPKRGTFIKPVRVLIAGIPNVGKSTLMNGLAGKTVAKVGNEPAVTKAQQKIDLPGFIALYDTPGLLWPKPKGERSGYVLALSGAIRDTAMDFYEEIALYLIGYIQSRYEGALVKRYKVDPSESSEEVLLENIAKHCGCDIRQASVRLVNDLRQGKLGRLTLELPEDIEPEDIEPHENQNA